MGTRIQSAAEMAMAFGGPVTEWAPTLLDSSYSTSEGQTYGANNEGYMIRVGNLCFIWGTLDVASLGSLTTTDAAYMGGLLYTAIANNTIISFGKASGLSLGSAGYSISGSPQLAAKRIELKTWETSAGQGVTNISEISATGELSFSGFYITDDPF